MMQDATEDDLNELDNYVTHWLTHHGHSKDAEVEMRPIGSTNWDAKMPLTKFIPSILDGSIGEDYEVRLVDGPPQFQNATVDDVEEISEFVANLNWLHENGYDDPTENEMQQVAQFVANLRHLEEIGEEPTEDRMNVVAAFVRNLEYV